MQIKVISITPNPIDIIYNAARQCYYKGYIGDYIDSDIVKNTFYFNNDVSYEDKIKLIQTCLKSGHTSIFEHASISFAISGLSRSCTHQLVRTRVGVTFSQQSQRYVKVKNFSIDNCVIPNTVKNNLEANERFSNILSALFNDIEKFNKDFPDIPDEDVRFLFPNALSSNIVWTVNFTALLKFFKERLCFRAQWEIRELAENILEIMLQIAPEIFTFAGPVCNNGNKCNQGKLTCGKPITRK